MKLGVLAIMKFFVCFFGFLVSDEKGIKERERERVK